MSVTGASSAQLARLSNFVVLERSAIVQLWQLNKTITALVQDWNADILGIIGAPQGTPIVDSTSYAGAAQLTDTQVTNLFGILQALSSTNMTPSNMAVFLLATGPNNML